MKITEKEYKTAGGIPIYVYPNPALHGAQISLFVRAGALYESASDSGITHFFEHIAIRNIHAAMGGDLYGLLDRHGIEFNASTYSEMVQFYVSCADSRVRRAAEILARVLSPVVLPKEEIDLERRRIKAEIRESDEASSLASFTDGIVYAGCPLSRSILGKCSTVDRIGGKRLEAYRRAAFIPENLFFYMTGNVTEADIAYLAKEADRYPLGKGEIHTNTLPVPAAFGKREGIYVKNADFTAVRFTFDADLEKCASVELDLLYDMLLSGYNSRFFIEMSEKRGLFYDLSGAIDRFRNIGCFYFSYEVKEKDLYSAVELTVSILREMKEKLQSPDSLMKTPYTENAYMLYDDARELGFTMAYDSHVMNLGYKSLDDRITAYSAVTPERIREVCRLLFTRGNLTFTMKGKKRSVDADRIEKILAALDDLNEKQ